MAQAQYTNHRRRRVALGRPHRAARRQRHQHDLQRDDRRQRHRRAGTRPTSPAAPSPPTSSRARRYDPDGANTFFRFMPSLAVDRVGDMAIGYTKSNSTTNPQIKYAGRLAGDPLNTLGQGEQTLIDGTGAQSGNCGSSACIRWGDYSGMALDPNGCEFWMTGEYYATTGLNHQTRIGSFHYPGCTHGRQRHALRHRHRRHEPDRGRDRHARQPDDDHRTGAATTRSPSRPGRTRPMTADQAGLRHRRSAATLAVPDGGTLTKNFTLSAAAQSGCFTDNTQSTFQRGVPTNCDLDREPGQRRARERRTTRPRRTRRSARPASASTTRRWAGQTFTPTVTGQLKRVDVELFCSGCTGDDSPNITRVDPRDDRRDAGADRRRPRHCDDRRASTTAAPAASRRSRSRARSR